MPRKPAKGKGSGKKGAQYPRMSRAKRAGLAFGVGRVLRHMKQGRYAPRTSEDAAVFLAGVLEYMVAELVEVSGEISTEDNKKTIHPRHIMIASRKDDELDVVLGNVTFPYSGTLENIQPVLLPKTNKKKKKKAKKVHMSASQNY